MEDVKLPNTKPLRSVHIQKARPLHPSGVDICYMINGLFSKKLSTNLPNYSDIKKLVKANEESNQKLKKQQNYVRSEALNKNVTMHI